MQFQFPECQKIDLSTIVTRASPPGMHLLKELLYWDPDKRPTAQQSLKYLFFQVIPLPSQHIVYKPATEQKHNFTAMTDDDNFKVDFAKPSLFAMTDAQKRIQQKQLMLENNIFNFAQGDLKNLENSTFLSEDSGLVSAKVDENQVNGGTRAAVVVADNSVVGDDVLDNGINPIVSSAQNNTSSTNFNSIEPRPRKESAVDRSESNEAILNIFQRANNNDSAQHMKKVSSRTILLDDYVPTAMHSVNNRNNFLNENIMNLINSQGNTGGYVDGNASQSHSVSHSGSIAADSNRRFSIRRPSRLAEDNDLFREKISDIYINRNVSGIYPNGGTMKKNDLFERLPLSQNIGFFLHNEGSGVANRSGVRRGDGNMFQQRPVEEREGGYLDMKLQGSTRSSQQPVHEVKRTTLDSWGAIEDDKLARILG